MQIYNDLEASKISLQRKNTGIRISLPGIVQSISIDGKIIFDSSNTSGSQSTKVATNYQEKEIKISLILIKKDFLTSYQLLETIEKLFKETEYSSSESLGDPSSGSEASMVVPVAYEIFNNHTSIRGIREVYFTGLTSSEDSGRDYIKAELTFQEIIYPQFTVEKEL